ncbi:MAG: carbohydrate-binding family 9-like protein [Verrucomicrobiota bacterium]
MKKRRICFKTIWTIFAVGFILQKLVAAPKIPEAKVPFATNAPIIDGEIHEKEWAQATVLHFLGDSDKGKKDKSRILLLWSPKGLFVGFDAIDRSFIYGNFPPKDPLYMEDTFEIFIDALGTPRQYFELQANPAGQTFLKNYVITAEPVLTSENRMTPEFIATHLWRFDDQLPPDFKIVSKINATQGSWKMEMFLPAAWLNHRHGGGPLTPQTFLMNFARHDWNQPPSVKNRQCQFYYWSAVLKGHPHLSPTLMGKVVLEKP